MLEKIKKNKKILWVILLIIIIFIGYYYFNIHQNKKNNYEVFKPKVKNLVKTISADGEVVADYEIILASEIPGIVSKTYIKEGDFVKKGQLLMKLKDIDYRNQINSAYIKQKINEASLEKTKNPNQNLDIDKAIVKDNTEIIFTNIKKTKNDIQTQMDSLDIYLDQVLRLDIDDYFDYTDADEIIYQPTLTYKLRSQIETSNLEEKRKNLNIKYFNYKKSNKNIDNAIFIINDFEDIVFYLYKNSKDFLGLSDQELEQEEQYLSDLKKQISDKKTNLINLKTSLLNLEKQLDSSKKSIKKIENTVNPADLKLAQEKIKQAKIETHSAYTQLQKTYIRAPKSGIIVKLYKETGEYTGPSISLLKINSKKQYLEVDVPEINIAKIKKNMDVEIKLDAFDNKIFKGKVDFIYPEKREKFGIIYYRTRIIFNEKDLKNENILPGMSAEVKIPYEKRDNVLSVERGIAKKDKKGYFVNIFDSKQNIIKKYFKSGFVGDNFVEVISGIDKNTNILKNKEEK